MMQGGQEVVVCFVAVRRNIRRPEGKMARLTTIVSFSVRRRISNTPSGTFTLLLLLFFLLLLLFFFFLFSSSLLLFLHTSVLSSSFSFHPFFLSSLSLVLLSFPILVFVPLFLPSFLPYIRFSMFFVSSLLSLPLYVSSLSLFFLPFLFNTCHISSLSLSLSLFPCFPVSLVLYLHISPTVPCRQNLYLFLLLFPFPAPTRLAPSPTPAPTIPATYPPVTPCTSPPSSHLSRLCTPPSWYSAPISLFPAVLFFFSSFLLFTTFLSLLPSIPFLAT